MTKKGKFVSSISGQLVYLVTSYGCRIKRCREILLFAVSVHYLLFPVISTSTYLPWYDGPLDGAPTAWYKRYRFTGNTGYKLALLSQPVLSGNKPALPKLTERQVQALQTCTCLFLQTPRSRLGQKEGKDMWLGVPWITVLSRGEGALAPSCRASQGYYQIWEIDARFFKLLVFWFCL